MESFLSQLIKMEPRGQRVKTLRSQLFASGNVFSEQAKETAGHNFTWKPMMDVTLSSHVTAATGQSELVSFASRYRTFFQNNTCVSMS